MFMKKTGIIAFALLVGTHVLIQSNFDANTAAMTPSGLCSMEHLCAQEQVLVNDSVSEMVQSNTVQTVWHATSMHALQLEVNGENLIVDQHQLLYVLEHDTWLPAYQLKVGDHVLIIDGRYLPITKITCLKGNPTECVGTAVDLGPNNKDSVLELAVNEQWVPWKPQEDVSGRYYIESMCNTQAGLSVILNGEKNRVELLFKSRIAAYRVNDETFAATIINGLERQKEEVSYGIWTCFQVSDSNYLRQLSAQSYTLSDYYRFMHFAFITDNEIVDILAYAEPEVTLLS